MEDAADDPDGPSGPFDRHADGLHAYAWSLLGDPDAAADATVDALLVAGSAELADPARVRAWLYALVRNEALRRCPPADRPAPAAEAAELALRHRLSPADVEAVLGRSVPATTAPATLGPLPVPGGPATWRMRVSLAADRRAEVVRRARPFEPDGFPVPLDRPRLSGRALVWSAAAVVAVALVLLVTVPGDGRTPTPPAAGGPALAAAVAVPQVRSEQRQAAPTLTATRLAPPPTTTAAAPPVREPATATPAATGTGTRPAPAPGRGGDRRPVPGAAGGTEPTPAPTATAGRGGATTLTVAWSAVPALGCGQRWTATVTATAAGPARADLTLVRASWADGGRRRAATLRPDGDHWTGLLTDLPLGEAVSVTVRASTAVGDTVAPARAILSYAC